MAIIANRTVDSSRKIMGRSVQIAGLRHSSGESYIALFPLAGSRAQPVKGRAFGAQRYDEVLKSADWDARRRVKAGRNKATSASQIAEAAIVRTQRNRNSHGVDCCCRVGNGLVHGRTRERR